MGHYYVNFYVPPFKSRRDKLPSNVLIRTLTLNMTIAYYSLKWWILRAGYWLSGQLPWINRFTREFQSKNSLVLQGFCTLNTDDLYISFTFSDTITTLINIWKLPAFVCSINSTISAISFLQAFYSSLDLQMGHFCKCRFEMTYEAGHVHLIWRVNFTICTIKRYENHPHFTT